MTVVINVSIAKNILSCFIDLIIIIISKTTPTIGNDASANKYK